MCKKLLRPLESRRGLATIRNVNAHSGYQQFMPLPSDERIRIAWPTPNHFLLDAPEKFFKRTLPFLLAAYGRCYTPRL
jgi:hypothetical protein